MKKQYPKWLLAALLVQGWSCAPKPRDPAVIIPQPVSVSPADGTFRLGARTVVGSNLGAREAARIWLDMPGKVSQDEASVALTLDESGFGSAGSYRLEIAPQGVEIKSASREGLFYGVQTLRQLRDAYGRKIPCGVIDDSPRFASRGLLLDASRHYLPVDFIRKTLDMMAYLKMNRLVWYLGGDGGWRLDIPACGARTAWRTEAEYARWKASGGGFCPRGTPGAYGAAYTEEEVREVVGYARARFIDVVPAFDLPCAHPAIAQALGLECPDGTDARAPEIVLNEEILSGVIGWFDPEFVYIGNGAADHARGSFCFECRPRVERGQTGDMLDSRYAFALCAAEDFLSKHGVRLMSWEESLRGVVTHDAAVVAWNSVQDAITAAGMGYDAILSPSAYASLDYCQDDPALDPVPSTGFLPLEKLYRYDPAAYDPQARDRVMGLQANLWTAYVSSPAEAEDKLYPRLFAFAETCWTYPQRKSIPDFRRRAQRMSHVLRKKGYHCRDVGVQEADRPESSRLSEHLAWGCEAAYRIPASRQFPGSGGGALTDGLRGGWSFDDGRWQGFAGTGMDVVIDLEAAREIRSVSADFMQNPAARIYLPQRVEVFASDDGEDFRRLGAVENQPGDGFAITACAWHGHATARYIRYAAVRGAEPGLWLFTDEVVVR